MLITWQRSQQKSWAPGGVLDTVKGVRDAIPDSAQQDIGDNADPVSHNLANSQPTNTAGSIATASASWYFSDPFYYQTHPAPW